MLPLYLTWTKLADPTLQSVALIPSLKCTTCIKNKNKKLAEATIYRCPLNFSLGGKIKTNGKCYNEQISHKYFICQRKKEERKNDRCWRRKKISLKRLTFQTIVRGCNLQMFLEALIYRTVGSCSSTQHRWLHIGGFQGNSTDCKDPLWEI